MIIIIIGIINIITIIINFFKILNIFMQKIEILIERINILINLNPTNLKNLGIKKKKKFIYTQALNLETIFD